MLTRIVVVRHGHTAANGGSARTVLSGRADLPLSARGHAQAAALACCDAVREADVLYSSPLQRARRTAELAVEHAPVVPCVDLQEIDCGELDGMDLAHVQRQFPTVWRASQSETDGGFRWPGGESYEDVRDRSVAAIAAIARQHVGQRVVVVTHAGVISQLLGYLRGMPPTRWSMFRPGNASISELDWRDERGAIVSFDRRDHLAPELRT